MITLTRPPYFLSTDVDSDDYKPEKLLSLEGFTSYIMYKWKLVITK